MDGAEDHENGGEMQTKNGPCTVQRNRASRAKTQQEIIAGFDKGSKHAAVILGLFFLAVALW